MTAENQHARPHATSSNNLPRAYKQGQLDALCSLYAIINACRLAFKSAGITRQLGCWELFTVLVEALDSLGKLSSVTCYGISLKDQNYLMAMTYKYLLGKHGLVLHIEKPLKATKKPKATEVFKLVDHHLAKPGTAALLDFKKASFRHWTVIGQVYKRQVYFCDSMGMKQKSFTEFQIGRFTNRKKMCFAKSGLILLHVTKLSQY